MTKKPELSKQDQELFRQAMRGIKPMKHTKVPPSSPQPPTSVPKRRKIEEETSIQDPFSDFETLPAVSSDDIIQFSRAGIQHKILRNLRNGKYNVEAILDLHGKTVVEARKSLSIFLSRCLSHQVRCVLMIHGKGRNSDKPILKNKLNHWLRQTDDVLAFCSATGRDGRGGALYVLLRAK